jgi:hypothetical protein
LSITVGILAIVIAIVILLVLWVRRTPRRDPGQADPDTRFHAVSISLASNACRSAKGLEGERFLSNEAPRLPLPKCDVKECQCRFVHYDDRRENEQRIGPDRDEPIGDNEKTKEERRLQDDRRDDGSKDYYS